MAATKHTSKHDAGQGARGGRNEQGNQSKRLDRKIKRKEHSRIQSDRFCITQMYKNDIFLPRFVFDNAKGKQTPPTSIFTHVGGVFRHGLVVHSIRHYRRLTEYNTLVRDIPPPE